MRSRQNLVLIAAVMATIGLVHCSPVKSDMMKISPSSDANNNTASNSNSTPDPVSATVVSNSSDSTVVSANLITPAQRAALQTFQTYGRFPIASGNGVAGLDESNFKVVIHVNQSNSVIGSQWQNVKMKLQLDTNSNTIYLVLANDTQDIADLEKYATQIDFSADENSGSTIVAAGGLQ